MVSESIGLQLRGLTKIDLKLGLMLFKCANMALLLLFRLTLCCTETDDALTVSVSDCCSLVADCIGEGGRLGVDGVCVVISVVAVGKTTALGRIELLYG